MRDPQDLGDLSDHDLADLRAAKQILEHPSLAMKIASLVGKPVEWALAKLPDKAREVVTHATKIALECALRAAVWSLDKESRIFSVPGASPRNLLHRVAVGGTGAAGGLFGLAGLPFELPVTTTVMLRSIAAHARTQGEDLSDVEARLECLLVFALGGTTRSDDGAEIGYFAVREAFARAVSDAAKHYAQRVVSSGSADKATPVIAKLIAALSSRFGVVVEERVAGQIVPIIGAAGAAALNLLFMKHFQDMARAHFTVRRLERAYGVDRVKQVYSTL